MGEVCVCEWEYVSECVCDSNLKGIATRGGDVDPRGILWLMVAVTLKSEM